VAGQCCIKLGRMQTFINSRFVDVVDSPAMTTNETIAAISTPPGVGAIAIVRLSGPLACPIVETLFTPGAPGYDGKFLRTHRAYYGQLNNRDGEEVDEVVVTTFLKPHSYTGEDLLEISCHGSPLIAKRILMLLIEGGARLAQPGEFTQRAFLNGRIDLTQAEGVLDLIQAKTKRQSQNALSLLKGNLGREIGAIRGTLLDILTGITAGIDFPEEVGEAPAEDLAKIFDETIERLEQLALTARSGKFLREGLKVAIVGRPNAGKSSLLNQLLKIDRAIVSELPGTTRDVIEEPLDINGLPVILIDTAGIRQTKDLLEQMGMERSERAIAEADLALHVADITHGWKDDEAKIAQMIGETPWILVQNKIDLLPESAPLENCKIPDYPGKLSQVNVSAKTGQGLPALNEQISTWALGKARGIAEGPTLNERQATLSAQAARDLSLARETVKQGMPQDCLATDLKMAIDRLSEVRGEMVSEELIASVFAKFCIGK
jgi:tRNA modification GTPase